MSTDTDIKQALEDLRGQVDQVMYGSAVTHSAGLADSLWEDTGTITIRTGPWEVSGKKNGDLEVVFETETERKEYHIHYEKIVALLDKVANIKVEGKKEDV